MERKVLKVKTNNTPEMTPQPMQQDIAPAPVPQQEQPAMNQEPMGNDANNFPPEKENFDAEVSADENSEPKKYIQQLAGKISQSLRTYNENNPQPDSDLNKYVVGMVNKQAVEFMTDEDKQEVLNDIQKDSDLNTQQDEMGDDNIPQGNDNMPQQNDEIPMENKKITLKLTENQYKHLFETQESLDEVINDLIGGEEQDQRMERDIDQIKVVNHQHTEPFIAKKFK